MALRLLNFIAYSFFVILLFAACKGESKNQSVHFYHWKLDNMLVDTSFYHNIQQLQSAPHYVHIMDISYDASMQAAVPKAIARFGKHHPLLNSPIIPVIYIESQVLKGYTDTNVGTLANRIIEGIQSFKRNNSVELAGVQIDCDWMEGDKATYFALLKSIKNKLNDYPLSCTIRLYPYKYNKKMGVPPVDYGVLMCYNMGTIKDVQTRNSIIDVHTLESYIKHVDYPLDVKIALPIFGWYVWFREQAYQHIIYMPKATAAADWLMQQTDNKYIVSKDTMIGMHYLRKGDILRNEFPTLETLDETVQLVDKHIKKKSDIILYHLDKTLFENYETFIQKMAASR